MVTQPRVVPLTDARAPDGLDVRAAIQRGKRMIGLFLPSQGMDKLLAIPLEAAHLAVPTRWIVNHEAARWRLVVLFSNVDLVEADWPELPAPYVERARPRDPYALTTTFVDDETWARWRRVLAHPDYGTVTESRVRAELEASPHHTLLA